MLNAIKSKVLGAARDERGAEMVEWIVVVAILAVVAGLVFGPNGVLRDAMNSGVSNISNIVSNAGS